MDREKMGLLRTLKGAPASLLFALFFEDAPLGTGDLARLTGWSQPQITAALRTLSNLELVANHSRYHGWALTQQGYALVGGASRAPAGRQPGCTQRPRCTQRPGSQFAAPNSRPSRTGSGLPRASQTAILSAGASQMDFGSPPLKEEELKSLNLKSLNPSSSVTGPGEPTPALPPSRKLLDRAPLLFGRPVFWGRKPLPDPAALLALLAQVYHRRGACRSPASVMYACLQRGVTPEETFLSHPQAYLPARYLEAVGLKPIELEPESGDGPSVLGPSVLGPSVTGPSVTGPEAGVSSIRDPESSGLDASSPPNTNPVVPGPEASSLNVSDPAASGPDSQPLTSTSQPPAPEGSKAVFCHLPGTPSHLGTPSPLRTPSLLGTPAPGVPLFAAQAWQRTVDQLRSQLPAGRGLRSLESLTLARYEPAGSLFVVSAGSPAERAWVEANLAPALERHLAGACGQASQVIFL